MNISIPDLRGIGLFGQPCGSAGSPSASGCFDKIGGRVRLKALVNTYEVDLGLMCEVGLGVGFYGCFYEIGRSFHKKLGGGYKSGLELIPIRIMFLIP